MIEFAVVGVGRMGGIHALNLYLGRVRGARLYAVCDTDAEALARARRRFRGVKAFPDVESLLADGKVQAVVVATPHYAHADVAVKCIERGVHTLVEKPLAVTEQEATRIAEAADAHPKTVVAVMLNQRTNPLYKRARRIVNAGGIGEVQRASFTITDWYRSQAYYNQGGWRATLSGEGGGTLINQCVHQLDILQWILGMPSAVRTVMHTKDRNITTENDVTTVFDYGDDVHCTFVAATHELHGENRFEIAGTRGRIVIDGLRMTVKKFDEDEREVNARTTKGYGKTGCTTRVYDYRAGWLFTLLGGGQQRRIIVNFAAAIAGRKELVSPVRDGLASVQLINASYVSGWTGERVKIPVEPALYTAMLNAKIEEERTATRGAASYNQTGKREEQQ